MHFNYFTLELQAVVLRPPQTPLPWGPRTYRTLNFVVDPFGLDSILPTQGSILDPCYDMWE